jgi:hypothetical protein
MTSKEFVIWFKGFAKSANPYNITPKQWEDVREVLDKVSDEEHELKFTRYKLDSTNYGINTSYDKKENND